MSENQRDKALRVGYFAYSPGFNPYQRLFRSALSGRGISVMPIEPATFFPIRQAIHVESSLLQFDWIAGMYTGRNAFTQQMKQLMYRDGLRLLRSTPVVWTVHNIVAHDSTLDTASHRRLIQRFVDVCDGLMFLSRRSVELFREEYSVSEGTHFECTRIGHFANFYPNRLSSEEARKRLQINQYSRVALLFGRLHAYKGVEGLISGFCGAATQRDILIIAGKPSSPLYGERLTSLVRSAASSTRGRILMRMGAIDESEVQTYYNAADFAILPFEKILNSASFMLAKTFGCPVVVPEIGSLMDYADPALDVLYPAQSPLAEVLVGAFERFDGDSAGDRSVRVKTACEEFSWDHLADAACRLYGAVSSAS